MVGGSLTLEGGTITGNTTTAQGGGVFVKNGTLTVKDGAAIYGNTAKGENFTTSESGRADRREVLKKALQDGTVTAADAQDFFSAGDIDNGASGKGESVVSNLMPGGGSHRWSGVDGGKAVTVGLGSAYYSDDYLVLTSHPTDADIAKLGSISGNIIDISLNYAHNHGGGVAANGVLMFGAQEGSYNVVDGAELNVTKAMKQVNTATGAVTDLTDSLDGYTFELVNENGETVASAVTDTDGNAEITIPADRFDAGRTEYSFILRERAGNEADIVYDDSTYEVAVTLIPEPEETVLIGTQSITIHRFDCDIKIKNDDGSELQDGTAPVFTNTVKYTPPETPPEEPNDKPNEKPDKPVEVSGDSPQTGDTTGIFIWIGLLTASLTGCITIILFSRKKRYNTKHIR